MRNQVVVGRQPIVNRDGAVVAYELLYRRRALDAGPITGEQMTVEVLMSALTIGVDHLVGDKTMFCNAERAVITGDTPVSLPPDRTVIEVLESVTIDDAIVEGCRALAAAGFRIALDDFIWREGAERILEIASVVKLDLLALGREATSVLVDRCRPYDVVLVAEKVETADDVEWARERGFDLFQGYAVGRPVLVHGRTVGPSAAAVVDLALSMLTNDMDLDTLDKTLRREPGLVVQILQMAAVGSHEGLRRPVRTVRDALVLLGTIRVRQWVAFTILSGQPGGSPDALTTALSRARMLELLAPVRGVGTPEVAFTVGLLSSLDLLLGVELADLDQTLDIDPQLRAAAIRREGPLGALADEVADYQRSLLSTPVVDPDGADGLARAQLDAAAAEAFGWAMPLVTSLGA